LTSDNGWLIRRSRTNADPASNIIVLLVVGRPDQYCLAFLTSTQRAFNDRVNKRPSCDRCHTRPPTPRRIEPPAAPPAVLPSSPTGGCGVLPRRKPRGQPL